MNPLIAAAVNELISKGIALGAEALEVFFNDLLAGKNVVDSLNDLAMTMAEKQALALDNLVAPKK